MRNLINCTLLFIGAISFQQNIFAECKKVRFSNIGWTDISASTAVATEILSVYGYETKSTILSIPMTFAGMKNKDIDIFLGNWMPSMKADIKPYLAQGSVETIGTVLKGAKYTLAVPAYVYDAGVKNFNDLAQHKEQFQGKIFGIEPGNDGNRNIQEIIKSNAFNLQSWKLIESSEQAMLMEVIQAVKRNKWIVFLGWEPHTMNKMIKMRYLDGGDKYFGPHEGESVVYINSRKNFSKECPDLAKFFRQYQLTIDEEQEIMSLILDKKMLPNSAAKYWIKNNFEKLKPWIHEIKTVDKNILSFPEFQKKYAAMNP
ncbi:choline ABC transporter substrate-binding protein [Pigmentibacter sp. JX0631]|uniref:choline ABC transporter substrate-binding protein n=1 Tax=Pigmentibacter sp. JX0631 TaxID=2976982 RepID=UPI002468B01A|nr:choline ABC transporter substrate-binding protein [Pigmentibacter sp. JX0631]WGL61091.1 choline ABC transporter substrate-binding protein [Pigmentibacter sp. JX0631]